MMWTASFTILHRALDLWEDGAHNDHREEVALFCGRTLFEARGERLGLPTH